jgi:hypothetical protein
MGLTTEELESAYGRAGRSFNGQLQQIFVVLNERDSDSLQSVAFKTGPAGGGRGGRAGAARGGAGPINRGTKRPGATLKNSTNKK